MFDASATIKRLPCHLPNQQWKYFMEDEESEPSENYEEDEEPKSSKLIAFFNLCRNNPHKTKDLMYLDVVKDYVWAENKWQERKSTPKLPVGRMPNIPLSAGEAFYLKMLLSSIPGPKSYEDLLDGCSSFKEACLERGILMSIREWEETLQGAALCQAGRSLRELFVTMLLHCEVEKPGPDTLFEKYWTSMHDSERRHKMLKQDR